MGPMPLGAAESEIRRAGGRRRPGSSRHRSLEAEGRLSQGASVLTAQAFSGSDEAHLHSPESSPLAQAAPCRSYPLLQGPIQQPLGQCLTDSSVFQPRRHGRLTTRPLAVPAAPSAPLPAGEGACLPSYNP